MDIITTPVKFYGHDMRFPVSEHMFRSDYPHDFWEDIVLTLGQLLDAGIPISVLPAPIVEMREASRLLSWLMSQMCGFRKYAIEEMWEPDQVNAALTGLRKLGMEKVAMLLEAPVAQLNAAWSRPHSFDGALSRVDDEFDRAGRAEVEALLRLERGDVGERTKRYIVGACDLDIVPRDQMQQRIALIIQQFRKPKSLI